MGNHLESMKTSWHPGFYGAMEIGLHGSQRMLEFQREYQLSKEPLRVDLMIIRNTSQIPIENEIGHIFKKYNILEYKSPDDKLSIDDYYKTVGYACLYKGMGETVNQIPAEKLTISIFRDRYPRKLFKALRKEGKSIEEVYPGVYYIRGKMLFDTQIVVTRRLKEGRHRGLRLLSHRAKEDDVRAFIKDAAQMTRPGDRNNIEAVLQVSIAANQELYDKIRRDTEMCDALRYLLREEIAEEKKTAKEEGIQEGIVAAIQHLMANMKWSAEQAMSAMSIPIEKQEFYKARL